MQLKCTDVSLIVPALLLRRKLNAYAQAKLWKKETCRGRLPEGWEVDVARLFQPIFKSECNNFLSSAMNLCQRSVTVTIKVHLQACEAGAYGTGYTQARTAEYDMRFSP